MSSFFEMLFGSDTQKKATALAIADDLTKVITQRVITETKGKLIKVAAVFTITLNDRADGGPKPQ